AKLVVYGGTTGQTPGATTYSNTWTFDGTTWSNIGSTQPGPRVSHALASDPINGRVVMFGGVTDLNNILSQTASTWTWNGSGWTIALPPAVRKSALGAASGYDPTHGVFWSYGGQDGFHNVLGELWSFDGVAWTLATLFDPGPRYLASGA